jgi:hypothetical protein
MLTGRSLKTIVLLASASLIAGCAQPGPITSRYTTIGALKTSLSHLEFENQQLKTRGSSLESENRDIEDKLVQEEAVNGDLSARLDDARNVLSQRGSGWGDGIAGSNGADSAPRALPAGRSNRSRRKPPFARIPGRVEENQPGAGFDEPFHGNSLPSAESLGPQSMLNDDGQWLPIAQGTSAPATKVR